MVAGVNLDMVGQDQDQCGSVFVIESPPAAMPSFAPDLLERLREEWMGEMPNLAGRMSYPLFRHTVSPFSGGSDHYILSDPSVGVPTPMLIQWPDKFYHTSEDTLDKVSSHMLAVVGGLAATYAYFVADARDRQVRWLGREMNARFRARLARSVQNSTTEGLAADRAEGLALIAARGERIARFSADRQREALRSLLRLAPGEGPLVETLCTEADEAARIEIERYRAALAQHARSLGLDVAQPPAQQAADEWDVQAAMLVPVRRFRGPVSTDSYSHMLTVQEKQEAWSWSKGLREHHEALGTLADYWADGRRTVAEIVDLVELETGQRNAELLIRHFRLLDRLGLMALESR
jgi:aminopeptidase YwaD